MDQNTQDRLVALSQKIFEAFERVETAVRTETADRSSGPRTQEFIATSTNSMVNESGNRAVADLATIRSSQDAGYLRVSCEPIIARVRVQDENGKERVYYFARANPFRNAPAGLDGVFASYHSPVGRLAEFPVGEDVLLRTPKGEKTFTVIERAKVNPLREEQLWDAINDVVQFEHRSLQISSLRALLSQYAETAEPEDLIGQLEAEERAEQAVIEGTRRAIVTRMTLRDQAILDQYQGEVFRLPIDRRLLLHGPPGTGKTTTLIKRVALKSRMGQLEAEELELVPEAQRDRVFHPDRWVMFTPTELLRLYVKEAFTREGVAASDERIRVWPEYRRGLARNVLRIVRSEKTQGFMLLATNETGLLVDGSSSALMSLAAHFEDWFKRQTTERYAERLRVIERDPNPVIAALGARIRRHLGTKINFSDLFGLIMMHADLAQAERSIQDDVDKGIRDYQNSCMNKHRDLLDRLRRTLESPAADEAERADRDDEDEDEAELTPNAGRVSPSQAAKAWRETVLRRAAEIVDGRSRTATGTSRRLLQELGEAAPKDEFLRTLGIKVVLLENLRYLGRTYQNLIEVIPKSYQVYRREMLREDKWYRRDQRSVIEKRSICGAEVDILALLMLRNARVFLTRDRNALLHSSATTRVAILDSVRGEYFTQVLVDEASDFSALQLACMLELSHPNVRSLFASGDVRQRVTTWGVQSIDELRQFVAADFDAREIKLGYRQSRLLAELAEEIAGRATQTPAHIAASADAQIRPVLGEELRGQALAVWLRTRIQEIERSVGRLPSVAIFVDGESRIDPVLNSLSPLLAEVNLEVIACRDGRVVGNQAQVRVFDLQHIKGLEFEAVFFVGIDVLAHEKPDLFDKFLYVGFTRAATYLGVTCEGHLPAALGRIRHRFETQGWG
jgi:DNA polymerase III delta prime subunit